MALPSMTLAVDASAPPMTTSDISMNERVEVEKSARDSVAAIGAVAAVDRAERTELE